jgi:hypothetical protein
MDIDSRVLWFAVYALASVAIVRWTGARHLERDGLALGLAIILIVALPAAQAWNNPRLTYPLDHWGMYASTTPPSRYYEYVVTTTKGRMYQYPFAQVAFSEPRALKSRLDELIAACRCQGGDAVVNDTIRALAAIHHASDGAIIRRVEVFEVDLRGGPLARHGPALRYTWRPSVESGTNWRPGHD